MHAHTWTKCKRATPLHAESADKENYIESMKSIWPAHWSTEGAITSTPASSPLLYTRRCVFAIERKSEGERVYAKGAKRSDMMKSFVFFAFQCVRRRHGDMASLSRAIHEHWN